MAKQFETLRSRLSSVLGGLALTIEHVGSTAVPGLAANRSSDIDVLLKSAADLPHATAALTSSDISIEAMWAFQAAKLSEPLHLYVCPDNREYLRHIAFRDHLRSHPEDASAYAALKRELALCVRNDRESYNKAKNDFVERILRTLANKKVLSNLAVSSANR